MANKEIYKSKKNDVAIELVKSDFSVKSKGKEIFTSKSRTNALMLAKGYEKGLADAKK